MLFLERLPEENPSIENIFLNVIKEISLDSLGFKYFYEVAKQGSLSGASEVLHVAVSAVSRQISHLEHRVGAALFVRSARGMDLTAAGHILLKHVRRVQLEMETTLSEITALHSPERQPIRLACTQGMAQELVPTLVAEFSQCYPQSRFRMYVSSAEIATERVATGEADIAITFSTTASDNVEVRYTCRAPALAVMSKKHALAKRKRVFIHDVQKYPLALTDENTSTFKLYQTVCNMTAQWVEPTVYSNSAESLHAYVRDSEAILFASYISVVGRLDRTQLVAIPIRNPEMHARLVQIQVMQGRVLPDLTERFVDKLIARMQKANEQAPH